MIRSVPDNCDPFLPQLVLKPLGNDLIKSNAFASFAAHSISAILIVDDFTGLRLRSKLRFSLYNVESATYIYGSQGG